METKITIPKIIAVLGGAFLLYVLVSNGTPSKTTNGGYIDEGDNDIINEPLSIANTLHEAMRGNDWNESDKQELIFSTLGNLTSVQFGQVFKAFGLRQYNTVLKNDLVPIGGWYNLTKHGLKTWLKNELSGSMYVQLKNKFKKYL